MALCILHIEDNPDDRALVRRELERAFAEIEIVPIHDQAELSQSLAANGFQAVITDFQLRWTDGLKVLNAVKARYPNCPVIMFTNSGTEEIAVEAMKSGLDDYLIKKTVVYPRVPLALKAALERVETRVRLAQNEEEFRAIFELSAVGKAQVDVATQRFTRVNRRFCEITGYSPEELCIMTFSELTYPEDREQDRALYERTQQKNESGWTSEKRYVHKDGHIVWVQVDGTFIRDANGRAIRSVEVIQDVTERKQRQTEIEALNTQLRRSIRETHHRVKNNLQIISSMLDMQAMQHQDFVPVDEIGKLRQHINALAAIHDLLTHQAKNDTEVYALSVKAAVQRLVPMLQATAGTRHVDFFIADIQIPVRQGTAVAVLVNELVSNAIKHGHGDITLHFSVEGGVAVLEVSDRGPGFPKGFEPLQAANTGLELIESLTRHDLSGSVHYANRLEGGAQVRIRFPLVPLECTEGEQ